jgi:hypothetical protein
MSGENESMDREEFISTLQQIKAIAEECLAELGGAAKLRGARKNFPQPRGRTPNAPSIDFDIPIRPFIKKYAKGMSGPQRFALLLARLVNGDLKKEVQLKEIEKTWNAMTALMDGMEFNRFFPSQAKDHDWVESKQRGSYNLRPNWKQIFE